MPRRVSRREARERRYDVPLPDAQRGQEEAALAVGDALDDDAAGGVRRRDGGAGQHAAGAVADDAADLAGVDLPLRGGGKREKNECDGPNTHGRHGASVLPGGQASCKGFVNR